MPLNMDYAKRSDGFASKGTSGDINDDVHKQMFFNDGDIASQPGVKRSIFYKIFEEIKLFLRGFVNAHN